MNFLIMGISEANKWKIWDIVMAILVATFSCKFHDLVVVTPNPKKQDLAKAAQLDVVILLLDSVVSDLKGDDDVGQRSEIVAKDDSVKAAVERGGVG